MTTSPSNLPPKCALPKMPPPTVPGVPAQASNPPHSWLIVHRTRPLTVTAASHSIRLSAIRVIVPPRGRSTRPCTPASDTSTFDPPPSIVTGTAAACASFSAVTTSARVRGSKNQSAGPPTRKVVYGARRTRLRTRSFPRVVRRNAPRSFKPTPPLGSHQGALLRDKSRQSLGLRAHDKQNGVARGKLSGDRQVC